MAQDPGLMICWNGDEENKIGELVATLEVDTESMDQFNDAITTALGSIDPERIEGMKELSEAIRIFVDNGIQASIDVYRACEPVFEQSAMAMERFSSAIAESFRPTIEKTIELWNNYIDAYDKYYNCEPAYREYVVKLNWKRGRGKKLSWRRLNREQRRDAIAEYLAEHGSMSL